MFQVIVGMGVFFSGLLVLIMFGDELGNMIYSFVLFYSFLVLVFSISMMVYDQFVSFLLYMIIGIVSVVGIIIGIVIDDINFMLVVVFVLEFGIWVLMFGGLGLVGVSLNKCCCV